jgi:hypothetical protein
MDSKKLLTLSKEELEKIFDSSPAGPIPNGVANGTALIAPGTPFTPEIAEFINLFAWQGKIFDASKGALVNRITMFGLDAILAKVYKDASWVVFNGLKLPFPLLIHVLQVDGKECIVLDYSSTSFVAHWVSRMCLKGH